MNRGLLEEIGLTGYLLFETRLKARGGMMWKVKIKLYRVIQGDTSYLNVRLHLVEFSYLDHIKEIHSHIDSKWPGWKVLDLSSYAKDGKLRYAQHTHI